LRLRFSAGVTSIASKGSPPVTVKYEPGLPGAFSLHCLNASGTRWYIRLRSGLRSGAVLTLVVAGGPRSGHSEFGIAIEAGG
jgi:hypothetical protein